MRVVKDIPKQAIMIEKKNCHEEYGRKELCMKKRLMSFLLALCMLATIFSTVSVSAATSWPATIGIKTYVLSTGNDTTVYQTASSTSKYGTIYASDLITINGYSGSRLKVTYPVSNGKTKTGYIEKSKVTTSAINSAFDRFTATGKVTVYRRAGGGSTLGSIAKGDIVYRIATSGSYTQLIYPISGGYKMGWCKTSDLPSTGSSSSSVNNSSSGAAVAEGTYVIVSALDNNKAVDVNGASTADCANIQLYTKNGTVAQIFRITKSGNYYTIINVGSNKAVDVANGSSASGANVQQYTPNGTNAQKWIFEDAGNGYYYIKSALGNYLDVLGAVTADYTNIQVYTGNRTNAQKFKLVLTSTSSNTSSYSQKMNAFINDARWKNGTAWKSSQRPKLSSYNGTGCCAYTADFAKYVFNNNSPRGGSVFYNPKDIRSGDILYVNGSSHWVVVLERNGNSLKTAEGNWNSKVVISEGVYTVSGNTLMRNGSKFRTFQCGYHFQ